MRRVIGALSVSVLTLLLAAGPALACGGLIGPNGAVNLLQTTTFAGYHDGVEHYVTAFEFAGGGGALGSITPLPGIPSNVEKGGDWTLQRLILETDPQPEALLFSLGAAAARDSAEEIARYRIDALDLTVLRGGAAAIGQWAKEHGFRLPPDAPEVLEFYAARSQIFVAAAFDADAAAERGQGIGDGTSVHITIPTDDPWVPLRVLALGKTAEQRVEADVYLLTEARPNLLPVPAGRNGISLAHSAEASDGLLADLRSDRGMAWVPAAAWLTKVRVDASAAQLSYDLAVDETGTKAPSRVDAGLDLSLPGPAEVVPAVTSAGAGALLAIVAFTFAVGAALHTVRPTGPSRPSAAH